MTVAELIKNLQMMPQDREVILELNSQTVWGNALSVSMYVFKDNGDLGGEVVISDDKPKEPYGDMFEH